MRRKKTQGWQHHYCNCLYWYAIATTATDELCCSNIFVSVSFLFTSCPHQLVNLAMVAVELQNQNKIHQNNITKLLPRDIYLENSKLVRQVIFWKHLQAVFWKSLSVIMNWLEKYFGISRKSCIIKNTSKNWNLIFVLVVVSLFASWIRHSKKLLIHITKDIRSTFHIVYVSYFPIQ